MRTLIGSNDHSADLEASIRLAKNALVREAEKDRSIRMLSNAVLELQAVQALSVRDNGEAEAEWKEALAMAGRGPWRSPHIEEGPKGERTYTESYSPMAAAQGAYGDTELVLQNAQWIREINFSWLEFSRWGIQQIILISRLYAIKNPLIVRGVNISALYVFGSGVEVSSPDKDADKVLQDFFARNKAVLGQNALIEQEKRKYYDGNLFWVFFRDEVNSGETNVRTIDATEVMEIVSDPDDSDTPRFYRRDWIRRDFDPSTGAYQNKATQAWYPALGYDPGVDKPPTIRGIEVRWAEPVLHRKCGGIAKWQFGCPIIYPAIDWAKAAKRFLENCMTIRDALAQFSMLLTTKGGQAAQQGAKQQLSTSVGPPAQIFDTNPTAVTGSIFSSGPGTTLEAFNSKGAGGDPAEVREYIRFVAMIFGIPESFFANMETSNLATATSLDRPTELNFRGKQEPWREDLVTISTFVLDTSYTATNGKLLEAKGIDKKRIPIREATRRKDKQGNWFYEVDSSPDADIQVLVNFPAIIEADVPAQVTAVVQAMTLGTKAGEVVGIDEKEGVRLLSNLVGIEDTEEILELMYPADDQDGNPAYDANRTKEPDPVEGAIDPVTGLPAAPKPGVPGAAAPPKPKPTKAAEAKRDVLIIKNALARVNKALRMFEAQIEDAEA